MKQILLKNVDAVVTCDDNDRLLRNCDILIEDNYIKLIDKNIEAPEAEVISMKGKFVYPGLINTHHHLLQAFTRNIPAVQNSELFDWLIYLYEVWKKVNPEFMYYSSTVAMGEFIKYGGTTLFDQHFAFPRSSSKEIIDRQFDAAADLGLRFYAGRSAFTRGKDQGGLPPMELIETTSQVLDDTARLVEKYHDDSKYSMRQVAFAACSPFSVDTEVMKESAKAARQLGVRLHTHLCETIDEENYCLEVYGDRPIAWAEKCDWLGPDVWFAHAVHLTDDEVRLLGETGTGVAHNPVSNMKLSSGIAKVPLMLKENVPVGLAVDGNGSNDASNLLADLRVCFLLHRLNSSKDAPTAYDTLKLATRGSARVLGRNDIGHLTEGMAADLFAIDIDQLEFVGATLDPKAMLGTVGHAQPVWMTMINGKVVYKDGELKGIDEVQVRKEAQDYVAGVYSDIDTGEE